MSFLHSADIVSEIESLAVGQCYYPKIDCGWLIKRLEGEFELLEIPQYGGNEFSVGFFCLDDTISLLKAANSLT